MEAIVRIEHVFAIAKVALMVFNFYEKHVIALNKDQPQRLIAKSGSNPPNPTTSCGSTQYATLQDF